MVNAHEIQVHFALAMLHARHVQANAEFIGHNVLTSPAQGAEFMGTPTIDHGQFNIAKKHMGNQWDFFLDLNDFQTHNWKIGRLNMIFADEKAMNMVIYRKMLRNHQQTWRV